MYISIDIGGTSTRVATFNDSSEIVELEKFSTNQNYKDSIEKTFKVIDKLIDGAEVEGVSIGLPGVVKAESFELVNLPHLLEWVGKPIAEDFAKKYSTKVVVANDTDLGGLGEAIEGAGKDDKIVAFVAVGTGFGGGRIVDDKIDVTHSGFEPGHMIINSESNDKQYLHSGSLESYVSGTALVEKYGVEKCSECNDINIWNEVGNNLAIGLVNISVMWSPDVIVMGGGVIINAGDRLVNPTKQFFAEKLKIFKEPKIKIAMLGDQANLIGGYYNIINYIKRK